MENGNVGDGNATITINEINHIDDIRKIESVIGKGEKFQSVVVTNYIKLSDS